MGSARQRHSGVRLLAAVALTLAALPVSAPAASAVPCNQLEYVTLNTLHVDLAPLKKSYRIGDVVPFKVDVSRPSENDPIGLGIAVERPASQPAEGVNVGIGLSIGRVFLPGYNLTNAEGKTIVKIKIAKYAPRGKMVQVQVFAYKEQLNTPCVVVEEQGYRVVQNAFKVKA